MAGKCRISVEIVDPSTRTVETMVFENASAELLRGSFPHAKFELDGDISRQEKRDLDY
jgi:hypothetical protein